MSSLKAFRIDQNNAHHCVRNAPNAQANLGEARRGRYRAGERVDLDPRLEGLIKKRIPGHAAY